jgi:hypothetical protein
MKFAHVLKWFLCLVFSLSTLNALAEPPAHAKGSPPTKTYWLDVFPTAGEFTFPFVDCGFPTEMTVELAGFWITHTGHPKRDVWEFYHSALVSRITNLVDTSIYVEGIPGQNLTRHWPQESFQGIAIETGVQIMVTLPGYGVVVREVGRIVYDWVTGDVSFLAGQWSSQDGDYQALCSALSG